MKKDSRELRTRDIKELDKEAQILKEEINKTMLEIQVNPEKNTNLIPRKKKRLSVILTLINEKKALASLNQIKK